MQSTYMVIVLINFLFFIVTLYLLNADTSPIIKAAIDFKVKLSRPLQPNFRTTIELFRTTDQE
jgi:hypothetical protein